MADIKLIDLFMSTLKGHYYEILISNVPSNFYDMVIVHERVEERLKNRKVQGGSSSQARTKKTFNNSYRKKEGGTNALYSKKGERKALQVPPTQMLYL